ncbi:MAG: hypothetical protein F4Y41_14060, partial [Gammaproteobacteria bacterium]|nr:hypothetical protein [Gammaproteobacteria bacterium]
MKRPLLNTSLGVWAAGLVFAASVAVVSCSSTDIAQPEPASPAAVPAPLPSPPAKASPAALEPELWIIAKPAPDAAVAAQVEDVLVTGSFIRRDNF